MTRQDVSFTSGIVPVLVAVLLFAGSVRSAAQDFTVLHAFAGGADGAYPDAGLIQDAAGNFYGTTQNGGNGGINCPVGCGTVFKLDRSGRVIVLYSFTAGTDGGAPLAGLVRDANDNLYGTTYSGGLQNPVCGQGCGTVFKVDQSGMETVLYSFRGGKDGSGPQADLVLDAAGNLYGTTAYGGANGFGTVFKLDRTSGQESVLHNFQLGNDGSLPSGVIRDSAGSLYGTTEYGGANNTGAGIVFKINKSGSESVLHTFYPTDVRGAAPRAGLVRDSAGNLYGTAAGGGAYNQGAVFKLDKQGNETVLFSFKGQFGETPVASLVRDQAGNLYGTTVNGGTYGLGIVFKLDAGGHGVVLHNFTGGADGANPFSNLLLDAEGNILGTTTGGGDLNCGARSGCGTVFKLKP